MVTIQSVAKFRSTVEEELEELGFEVTHTDRQYKDTAFNSIPVYDEVEAYISHNEYDTELEMALDDIVERTKWGWRTWDNAEHRQGILFERHLDPDNAGFL